MTELENNLTQILSEKSTKIIPENIKKGVTIFNVTGTAETSAAGVKLFKTEEEMQADTNAKEGDLAVVYRSEIQNATVDSKFQVATFPDTVVLDTAISDRVEVRYRAVDSSKMFDCWGSLDSSRFMMDCYTETGEVRIQYTSSDGITYTRTRLQGDSGDLENPVDFGTEIYYEMAEMWNDAIGKFIQVGGNTFEGLFEGKTANGINVPALSSISFTVNGTSIENINFTKDNYYTLKNNDILQNLLEKIRNDIGFEFNLVNDGFLLGFDENNKLCAYIAYNTRTNLAWTYDCNYYRSLLYDASTSEYKGIYYNDTSMLNAAIGMYKFVLDLENQTYTKSVINKAQIGSTNRIYFPENFHSILVRYDIINKYSDNPDDIINKYSGNEEIYVQVVSGSSFTNTNLGTNINSVNAEKENFGYDVFQYIKYFSAPTQLTTTSDYVYKQLLFYGKNGVESGTLGIPDNSFVDTTAKVYNEIQNQYDNMEPRILTDDDKTIDKNIYFIPAKRDGTPLLDTSNVTNMSHMFQDCKNLTTIPLLDTSKVIDMQRMFNGCRNLTTISQLDTSKVTNMESMFDSCTNLQTIPLLDTSKVTDNMANMFKNCTNLTTIPQLDTSKVTIMANMFYYCTNLTTIPQLDTSSATNMSGMFGNCTNLTTIPQLDTSKVTYMSNMFSNCRNLTTIPLLDTSSVTDTSGMFAACLSLTTIPLLDTSKVTKMSNMFNGCRNLTTIPELDTSKVTYMSYMFDGCRNLTTIPKLNTSNATGMSSMFTDCTNLATIPLLDTSKVTDMTSMFNGCTNLTTIPLLDTSSVTNMGYMFKNCTNLTTIPLLDTNKVTNMTNMFAGCSSLSDESLNNILAMCKNATKITANKTLKYVGLSSAQANKCKTLSNYSAFTAAGWTTGY